MCRARLLKFADRWLGTALARLLPRPLLPAAQAPNPQAILLIRPGGIGDAVLLAPTIQIIKKHLPTAVIDVLAERRNAEAFALCPGIRSVFLYDRPRQFLTALRTRYDVVIDTEQWHRLSAIVARLTRAPVKIGFATNGRARMFTHAITYGPDDYEADSFLRLVKPLGINSTVAVTSWLQIPETAARAVAKLLPADDPTPLVAVFPGASIPEKRWGDDRFREVVRWCAEQNFKVVLIGGGGEQEVAGRIAGTGAINLVGMTGLAETAAVLARAAVVVSGDSGVLHLAAGLGRPTVALFGPSSASKWGPRGGRHIVLRSTDCPSCSHFGYTPPCPCGVRCLQEISVADVVGAIEVLVRE